MIKHSDDFSNEKCEICGRSMTKELKNDKWIKICPSGPHITKGQLIAKFLFENSKALGNGW